MPLLNNTLVGFEFTRTDTNVTEWASKADANSFHQYGDTNRYMAGGSFYVDYPDAENNILTSYQGVLQFAGLPDKSETVTEAILRIPVLTFYKEFRAQIYGVLNADMGTPSTSNLASDQTLTTAKVTFCNNPNPAATYTPTPAVSNTQYSNFSNSDYWIPEPARYVEIDVASILNELRQDPSYDNGDPLTLIWVTDPSSTGHAQLATNDSTLGLDQAGITYTSQAGSVDPDPEPVADLRVEIFSASILAQMAARNANTGLATFQAMLRYAGLTNATVGATYANGGDTAEDYASKVGSLVSDTSGLSNVLTIMHGPGNNITRDGPYPGGVSTIQTNMETVAQQITGAGHKLMWGSVSYRIPPNSNPSEPYNTNVILPLAQTYSPDFYDKYDLHGYTFEHQDLLEGDGVHPGNELEHFLASYTARVAAKELMNGVNPTGQSLVGTKVVIDVGTATVYENGIMPAFVAVGTAGAESIDGAISSPVLRDTGGRFLWGTYLESENWGSVNTTGGGNGGNTDTSLENHLLRMRSAYFNTNNDAVGASKVFIKGLPEGLSGTVLLTASRDSTAGDRIAEYTVQGTTHALDAENESIVSFPFTIGSDGTLTIEGVLADGSTYGYLNGIELNFNAFVPPSTGGRTLYDIDFSDFENQVLAGDTVVVTTSTIPAFVLENLSFDPKVTIISTNNTAITKAKVSGNYDGASAQFNTCSGFIFDGFDLTGGDYGVYGLNSDRFEVRNCRTFDTGKIPVHFDVQGAVVLDDIWLHHNRAYNSGQEVLTEGQAFVVGTFDEADVLNGRVTNTIVEYNKAYNVSAACTDIKCQVTDAIIRYNEYYNCDLSTGPAVAIAIEPIANKPDAYYKVYGNVAREITNATADMLEYIAIGNGDAEIHDNTLVIPKEYRKNALMAAIVARNTFSSNTKDVHIWNNNIVGFEDDPDYTGWNTRINFGGPDTAPSSWDCNYFNTAPSGFVQPEPAERTPTRSLNNTALSTGTSVVITTQDIMYVSSAKIVVAGVEQQVEFDSIHNQHSFIFDRGDLPNGNGVYSFVGDGVTYSTNITVSPAGGMIFTDIAGPDTSERSLLHGVSSAILAGPMQFEWNPVTSNNNTMSISNKGIPTINKGTGTDQMFIRFWSGVSGFWQDIFTAEYQDLGYIGSNKVDPMIIRVLMNTPIFIEKGSNFTSINSPSIKVVDKGNSFNAYVNRDNTAEFIFMESGVPINLDMVTEIRFIVGSYQFSDSVGSFTSKFRRGADGFLEIKVGELGIPVGTHNFYFVLYTSTHVQGIVWNVKEDYKVNVISD